MRWAQLSMAVGGTRVAAPSSRCIDAATTTSALHQRARGRSAVTRGRSHVRIRSSGAADEVQCEDGNAAAPDAMRGGVSAAVSLLAAIAMTLAPAAPSGTFWGVGGERLPPCCRASGGGGSPLDELLVVMTPEHEAKVRLAAARRRVARRREPTKDGEGP